MKNRSNLSKTRCRIIFIVGLLIRLMLGGKMMKNIRMTVKKVRVIITNTTIIKVILVEL